LLLRNRLGHGIVLRCRDAARDVSLSETYALNVGGEVILVVKSAQDWRR